MSGEHAEPPVKKTNLLMQRIKLFGSCCGIHSAATETTTLADIQAQILMN